MSAPPVLLVLALAVAQASAPGAPSDLGGAIIGARFPSLSPDGSQLSFCRDGDVWRCSATGGRATRLTVHAAYDARPVWSPDGKWVAFSSNRHGGHDVFVMPASGGPPIRYTRHPADDLVCDWSPDGRSILFSSARASRRPDLYTVDLADGRVIRRTREPRGAVLGRYVPGGRDLVVMAGWQEWWQTSYRGSAHAGIGIVPLAGALRDDQPSSRAPMRFLGDWTGSDGLPAAGEEVLWLVSTRSGSSEVWRTDREGRHWTQVTRQGGPAISWLSSSRDGSRLVYERGGRLWLVDPRHPEALAEARAAVESDGRRERVVAVSQQDGFRGLSVSPDGKQLALVAAGDLWIVEIGGGDARRLTTGEGVEGAAAWSPDGKRLAYVARPSGRTDLFTRDVSAGPPTRVTDNDAWERDPALAPDGARLSFIREGGPNAGLVVRQLAGEPGPGVPAEVVVAPGGEYDGYCWSPEGRWLAYCREDERGFRDVHMVASVGGAAVNITRSAGALSDPRWLPDGSAVVCSGTHLGQTGVFALPLRRDPSGAPGASGSQVTDHPAAEPGQGDTEPLAQRRRARPPPGDAGVPSGTTPGVLPWPFGPAAARAERVIVEFDNIDGRLRLVASAPKAPTGLTVAPDGRSVVITTALDSGPGLIAANLGSRAVLPLCPTDGGTGPAIVLPDGSGLLWLDGAGAVRMVKRGSNAPAQVQINCRHDRDRQWETSRLVADAAAGLRRSGVSRSVGASDWDALVRAWTEIATTSDADDDRAAALLGLAGQLGAVRFAASAASPAGDLPGCLGIAFDDTYPGPGVRIAAVATQGPADQPGNAIVAGEYVHAIDGKASTSPEQFWSLLEGTAGRIVEVTVGTSPPTESSEPRPGIRKLTMRAVAFATAMGQWEADEDVRNGQRVAALSSGTVRYVRVREVGEGGIEDLRKRMLGGLEGVRGLVVDLRDADGSNGTAGTYAALSDVVRGATAPGGRADARTQVKGVALVVLVNERTAGAAEAVVCLAATSGLCTVVGSVLPGLRCGLIPLPLDGGMRVRMPGPCFVTLDGSPLAVPKPAVEVAAGEDPDVVLAKAVEVALEALR